jgi:very-short-patch-repair endonuclease
MTPVEKLLWHELRGHRLSGFGIRRQHPFGLFVIDFACPSRLLAIEVDGSIHEDQKEQDAARTEILESWGWQVIRFPNQRVVHELGLVLAEIESALRNRPIAPGHRPMFELDP